MNHLTWAYLRTSTKCWRKKIRKCLQRDAFELKSSGKCGIPFDECDNFPTSSQQLRQHPSPLSRDISCHNCNEKFRKVQLYRNHIEVCLRRIRPTNDSQPLSSNQKKSSVFVCEICNANFNRLNLLVKHQLKHKPKSEWKEKCHICDLSFERHALLARHLKTAHAESDQSPWKCRHCGKHMMTKLSLGIHERIHTGAKPYVCEWCGQRFRSRANLLQHHPKHTGIKKHKCEECGKQFSRKSFVTAHMRVHTGERPFSCSICNRKFTQIGDMRRHEKKHEISIKHGRTCYTVIDINKNQSSDSVSTADSDDPLTDSEIALNVKVIQDC
nr:PREDICTED: oocyte zinc finger protein XlCOF10-like isoform X1 [Bemisia tabaci]